MFFLEGFLLTFDQPVGVLIDCEGIEGVDLALDKAV